ncbi:MAG: GNAT family N-acetyltransferase [Actinomycetota bacterium]|nr:GNAT family N-acetyltransferase [Actinomycetota bacterium]
MTKIVIKTSKEISDNEWESYTDSFNVVFSKNAKIEDFRQKYLFTIDEQSFHVFLKTTEEEVVGSCTVIPYNYLAFGTMMKTGLAVDVFIREEYRNDPLILYKMYKTLKQKLIENKILLVIAVPNDIAYPYWKNIVKWKDIGLIDYYALPLKAGNVIKRKHRFLNFLSYVSSKGMILLSYFFKSSEKTFPIRIDRSNDILYKQRYTLEHKIKEIESVIFAYRVVQEGDTRSCYLIDFYNKKNNKKDTKSLRTAIKYIIRSENIDIIIFVGKLSFFQNLLFKVPYKYEPKHLYFTADILSAANIKDEQKLLDITNWDFGLFNYDVR